MTIWFFSIELARGLCRVSHN